MLKAGIGIAVVIVLVGLVSMLRGGKRRVSVPRGLAATLVGSLVAAAAVLLTGNTATAVIVPTVGMGTAADFSVLAGQSVTNTGPSILNNSLGVDPGSAISGFPPGIVLAPATIHAADAVALQAQSDLTTAYNDAAGRTIDVNTPNVDLTGLTLVGGVYAGPGPRARRCSCRER